MEKNDHANIRITSVNAEGYGTGTANGLVVFTRGALPGDYLQIKLVQVRKNFAYGKIVQVVDPSPHRLTGENASRVCPLAERCGGCIWQHCDYRAQLHFKKQMVRDAFLTIAGMADAPVCDVTGSASPYGYCNKAQYVVGGADGRAAAGFYAPRSHRLVEIKNCNIQHPSHEKILSRIMGFIAEQKILPYDEATHTGLARHILIRTSFGTGESMAALVINGSAFPKRGAFIEALKGTGVTSVCYITNRSRTNAALAGSTHVLCGSGTLEEKIGGVAYSISPSSFFQVNHAQISVLYDTVLQLADFCGCETVIDAHAGAGGIALYVSRSVKNVTGIEISPQAAEDAKRNAAANGMDNVKFVTGESEKVITDHVAGADAVILNPPRKGCGRELLDAIAASGVKKIIYVSCNPGTLARDVKILCGAGFMLECVRPVDMFPQTAHIECVCGMTRGGKPNC
ncbi:MAG: 23S rRNA (uracil(1939)-C(5))-methyltransferase RlmD [Defluviitaleaceae bacterium]|nr:23S rRNA (uracil(1939)-C(5))-methyltransferase RlmD [Defluviitaleaceae bacterium]